MEGIDIGFEPTLPVAIRRAAAEFGDRDFLVLPDERMTYAEAEERSALLARRMLAAGIGKGSRVGLWFTYSTEWVVSWLAASRIGAVVMPFSTLFRPPELRQVLRIGDVGLLLVPADLLGQEALPLVEVAAGGLEGQRADAIATAELPFLRSVWVFGPAVAPWATSVGPDDEGPLVPPEVLAAAEAQVVPADIAIVVYTSGSSAEPKGVVHSQGGLLRATHEFSQMNLVDGEPTSLMLAMPFFWIGGFLGLCGAIQVGLTLVCLPRFEPGLALELAESEQISRLLAWPTLVMAMRSHPTFPDRRLGPIPTLTEGPADIATLDTPEPGVPAHRGMSETVGQFQNIEVKVIDPATGAALPDGETGELLVRGPTTLLGYYKREREEVFDPDGWLHTGDRCFLHEGRAFFRGRNTEMIKSQGANVAPREVELLLESFPEVKYAFVVGIPHVERGEEVVGILVAEGGATIDVDDVRQRARKEISAFKVPTRWVVLDEAEVPWLGSGKPDKRSLKARLADG